VPPHTTVACWAIVGQLPFKSEPKKGDYVRAERKRDKDADAQHRGRYGRHIDLDAVVRDQIGAFMGTVDAAKMERQKG